MDLLKQVVAEWVLTNGKLPGFADRVQETLPLWSVLEKPMVVYRAQGGSVTLPSGTSGPETLSIGVRPVIATSKNSHSILRYAGETCCIFEITLLPGTRYIDVSRTIKFDADDGPALAVKNEVLERVLEMCTPPGSGTWPTSSTSLSAVRLAILTRCAGRTIKKTEERIPPEMEIMVYGLEGSISAPLPIDRGIEGKKAFAVTYTPPPPAGRGRTFRRKAKRSNKNGRRSTRKSGHKRHRNP